MGSRIDPKRFDEERRLLYVAMTRASHELHMVFGTPSQSSFFKHLAIT
ncbi:ATP-binding domain-containing protein [Escherichia coli]